MLTVKKLRETCPPQEIMAWSGLFAAPMMFVVALASSETIVTPQLNGWLVLLGLALVSHFAGQGLIAYAFGHLPASLTSLNLLLQPVFAAVLAWALLGAGAGRSPTPRSSYRSRGIVPCESPRKVQIILCGLAKRGSLLAEWMDFRQRKPRYRWTRRDDDAYRCCCAARGTA